VLGLRLVEDERSRKTGLVEYTGE